MFKTASSQSIIAMLVILLFCAVVLLLLLRPLAIDGTTEKFLTLLLGVLISKFGSVIDFYLGSSVGSKHAQETISQLATGTGTGTGAASPTMMEK